MNKNTEKLYNLLPRAYRTYDEKNRYVLKRYLDILVEGGIDKAEEEVWGLLNLFDYDKVPQEYLPLLGEALGFTFPYDLDERTQRTYVKNAVASYKIKGTKKALEFMIRELTRFKTDVELDDETRTINIYLEVDMSRQNYSRVVEKLDFIIQEYAPPLTNYNVINLFIWDDTLNNFVHDRNYDTVSIQYNQEQEVPLDIGIQEHTVITLADTEEVTLFPNQRYKRFVMNSAKSKMNDKDYMMNHAPHDMTL